MIRISRYTTGVRSSRKIETRCHDDVAFRFLAANTAPHFRSIARFRARHLAALEALFLQALLLCQQAGKLLLRGHDNARSKWRLLAACHNL